MNKQFVAILVAIALIFGGLFYATKHKASKTNSANNNSPVQLSEHIFGDNQKGVTLTEYGDYQCPACGAYYPIVKQLTDKYKTDIHFQFRNYPLIEIHQNALIAARAAEAAGMQNKYWEMHDMLYENQKSWETSSNAGKFFEDYAAQLGLNVEKFRTDMFSDGVNKVVQADRAEAKKLGLTGTPTFLIDGKKIEQSPRDLESFEKLITDAIAEKNPTPTQPNPTATQ